MSIIVSLSLAQFGTQKGGTRTKKHRHKNGFTGLIPLTPGPSQGVTHTPTGYRLWGSSGTRGE